MHGRRFATVASLLVLLFVAGWWGLSHRSAEAPSSELGAAPNASLSISNPYDQLVDPSQSRKPGETILLTGAGQGTRAFSLDKLSQDASHLILRWACSGAGTWQEYLDGVLYSAGPCASDTLATADLPILAAHLHPKMMLIAAPSDMYWRISVAQLGGGFG